MPKPTLALCIDFGATPAAAPDEVQLIPAGPQVVGRDGRHWTFDAASAQAVLAAFASNAAELPIDWEHASQHRAPSGLPAPAGGWIEALEVRDGALWGRVRWTERAAAQIAAREYRYLSPVFDFDPTTGAIVRLVGAGLTNLPNLHLQALNREESPMERSAQLTAAIVAALGLAADATDDVVATAINQLKAQADESMARATNAEKAQPSLDRYVPRADYDALVVRATNAEQAIKARDTAAHNAAVDSAIEAALEAGKITPATAEYHRASCSDHAGLERFRAFVDAAPAVVAPSTLGGKRVDGTAAALNADERAICAAAGISHEDFIKSRDLEATA